MTGLIILAAGSSSRLGRAKQKLVYNGKSLLQHAVEEGLASNCSVIVVVLGAEADILSPDLEKYNVLIAINSRWEEGMSSSIRCGLSNLLNNLPELKEVVIMLCDQPFVDAGIVNTLIEKKQESGKSIAACTYDQTLGTPVVFDRLFFDRLLALQGPQGAKKLVFDNGTEVVSVPFPLGNIDIDTSADYEKLKKYKI